MSVSDSPRTVVLGFDALDFRYLDEFEDSLPNFATLRSEGVEAPLDSTFPPWTGSAWPSMYTGTDPSHHGVFSFFEYEDSNPETAELATRADVKQPAIWNYLTAEDVPAIVLNVPMTSPADDVEGVLVPGYLAPENADGHPEGIREELSDALGERYRIYSRAESSDDGEEKLAGYLDLIEMRTEAATYLLSEYDWEVAVIQVQKTDAVFHNFDDREAFRRVYERADALVGEVRDSLDEPANVVVCSDHGMGPMDGYAVYVNDVLEDHGFVESTADAVHPSLATRKSTLTGDTDEAGDDGGGGVAAALAGVVSKSPLSPGTVYRLSQRLGLESTLRALVPRDVISSLKRGVDWRASEAYCRLGSELGIRINLRGRDADGVVPESEYEEMRDDIIEILSGLKTPEGEPVFEFVCRREKLYDGPYTEDAPDVLFMPTGMNHSIGTRIVDTQFVPYEAYDHKRTGVFLGAGPAFEGGGELDGLDLTDVAPTVLALAGLPVPERMTGAVPSGLLRRSVETAAYKGLTYGDGDRADRDEEVTEHLRDLGYM